MAGRLDGRVDGARTRRSRALGAAAILVLVVAAAACRPLPTGSASSQLGDNPAACPQFQPVQSPPCGPQPGIWAAITGPYELFENGDPYSTKCGRNLTASVAACTSGPYAGGATNALYDPTGFEYAVDVHPEDVGKPLTLQVWDAGVYPRSLIPATRTVAGVSMASGSTTLTRTSGTGTFQAADVGKPITGTGIPAGATVAALIASNQVTISAPATSSGAGRTVTIATTPADCTATQAPFNAPPYNGMVGTQQCQTGDSGSSPFQLQLFDNDGVDDSIAYDQPITGCQLYVPAGSGAATYKNAWASVCTFTPTTAGIYPFRIKSSAITLPNGTVVTDTGSGYNGFALRVQGATATTVQQTGELSIWLNQFASTSQVYLTEITSADAGKLMQIDMFDVGDGNVGQYTLQVLAPPSGAPGIVPSGGTVIPAPGLADSCRYNPTPSPTRGPDVAAPAGAEAPSCTVVTRFAGSSTGVYNNNWLSIEIDIAEDYSCETDCWWTVKYDFGSTGVPSDRTVWAPLVLDQPAPPEPTTTTTFGSVGNPINGEPTTTTTFGSIGEPITG